MGLIIDTPRKKPRQLRSRETVEAVLEAAAQVFDREALSATTNRIAARAGVSIGTLYQYFPNKYALIQAIAERHVAQAGVRLDPVFRRLREEEPSFDDAMRAILDVVVDLHQERPALHRLMHRLAPRHPEGLAALEAFENFLANEVGYHLRRCGRGGDDPLHTAQTVVHAIDAYVHRVSTRQRMQTADLLDLVALLAPDPARK